MGEQGRTIGDRARIAAGNAIERDREAATAALIRRLVEENEQLRRDNDVLAIGIGELLARVDALERAGKDTHPEVSPYAIPRVDPAREMIAALRQRVAS